MHRIAMPTFLSGDVSGQGSMAISGPGGPYIDIFPLLTVQGDVETFNTVGPIRLGRAGWYGIGWAAGGGSPDAMEWWEYLHFNFEVVPFPLGLIYGDTLFWNCLNGAHFSIGIDY